MLPENEEKLLHQVFAKFSEARDSYNNAVNAINDLDKRLVNGFAKLAGDLFDEYGYVLAKIPCNIEFDVPNTDVTFELSEECGNSGTFSAALRQDGTIVLWAERGKYTNGEVTVHKKEMPEGVYRNAARAFLDNFIRADFFDKVINRLDDLTHTFVTDTENINKILKGE